MNVNSPIDVDDIGTSAVEKTGDVRLRGQRGGSRNPRGHNVWRLVDGDKAKMPSIGAGLTGGAPPPVEAVCTQLPLTAGECDDLGAIDNDPDLVFYRVRAYCADGLEGP